MFTYVSNMFISLSLKNAIFTYHVIFVSIFLLKIHMMIFRISYAPSRCPRQSEVPSGVVDFKYCTQPKNKSQPAPTPRTAPVPPQSAAPEYPCPPFSHHYTPWPADAAQWTPGSNRQLLPLAPAQ